MKFLDQLTTPWLLRRLIKANEKQTLALEAIRDALYIGLNIPRAPTEESGEDDEDLSYAADKDTYEREERDRRRIGSYSRD